MVLNLKMVKRSLVLGMGLTLAAMTAPAFAGDDSSSDAAGGFGAQLDQANGVIVRVPINAQGDELTDAAELRMHAGQDMSTSGDFEAAFAAGTDATSQPNVTAADVSRDSSTSGWYGDYSRSCGWQHNYYYSYQPTYYYSGDYWRYQTNCYRDYRGGFGDDNRYYGYRYYYYNRCRY